MSPSSRLILALGKRIKYSLSIIIVISIVVYIISKKHYAKQPRFYFSESLLFPVSNTAQNQNDVPSFLSSYSNDASSSQSFYNLSELISSRTIREEISQKIVDYQGRKIYVFDEAIRDYNTNPVNKGKFTITDDFQHNVIYGAKALANVIRVETEDNSGFVKLYCDSYSEDFAVALGNVVIDVLSEFYVKFNEKPLNYSFQKISRTKDSLEYELNKYEIAFAKYLDENRYIANTEESIAARRYERRIQGIQSALNAVTQSYYNAKNKVEENKPIIKVLDRPQKPLSKEANNFKLYPIAFALLTFVVLLLLSHTDLFIQYFSELIQAEKQKLLNQESETYT